MIDSTSSSAGTAGANALSAEFTKPASHRAGGGRERLSTEKADQLRTLLGSEPEVRPEMVAKGRAMAADPNYPSAAVIRQVASLIVNSTDPSEDQS